MKIETVRRFIMIVIIAAFIAVTVILIVRRVQAERSRPDVAFRMPANGSAGEHFEYAFDRDNILREKGSYTKRFFLNFGPGYDDVWEFDIIGEGELTVSWTKYRGGSVDRDGCFDETYLVKDGKCVKISDDRKNT